MTPRVPGCSGGASNLSINELARIDHVFDFRSHVWITGAA